MNKPPKNFNTKQAKELKKEFIEVYDEDKIGDANNFWYKKFKYLGKKYIMETKKKYAEIKEFIIYCRYYFIKQLRTAKHWYID